MNYLLLKETIDLVQDFENENAKSSSYPDNVEGFKMWMMNRFKTQYSKVVEPVWEGKITGRSPESIIATLIVHMNRYARNYFKSAIHGSAFSTQDDVIYLIVLRFSPPLTKMELIKKNVHDKPAGMQIINRLVVNGWVKQKESETDKRSKQICITPKGIKALDALMEKVRQATNIVSARLTHTEKMSLITLLNKLNDFHLPVYEKSYDTPQLLQNVIKEINQN